MDIIKLIEEMEDILDEASTVPFSKKVMVEREELLSGLRAEIARSFDDLEHGRTYSLDEVRANLGI